MKADVIQIDPGAYGIWYIDALDKEDRYKGKVVEFTAMVLKSPEFLLRGGYDLPGLCMQGKRGQDPGDRNVGKGPGQDRI